MSRSIIITAGGAGLRMGSLKPKQFLEINNRPILFYTIDKFLSVDPDIEIILVLPENHILTWKNLCDKFNYEVPHLIVTGGKERFHSVKNGLAASKGEYIGIHDAVRPFVSEEVILNAFEAVTLNKAVVPVMPVLETLRQVKIKHSETVDRSKYRLVQTPQVFQRKVILDAYEQEFKNSFTDDASVVESNGEKVFLIDGNEANIKITRPIDLKFAEVLLHE